MRIRCPYCGERDNGEFTYLGDAGGARPDGMGTDAAAMHDYVYLRDNRAGVHRELWYHGAGCRSWLVVTRDTRTHEISDVTSAREAGLARRNSGTTSGEAA
ncbi:MULTISPECIES: sarcosine oxidase subunit delta [Methylobacterium]|uniref:Sarcosine oxidase subunit delta n=1 Tax=Methylobacterium jeotgali TaxID=381630 RepID=A0ABQ4SVK2_9HYPH|nr:MULTISPECIES: sarcosine oxidase subunit delta [Methylobacterium]PIU05903.1 MAG: sarcosine oxidase subunit delta [Methylobacterium sp. CG09_land_8_20_14_0_10_71_15]PIU12729.1 MAG: sarcosine oxidase subunit delta [Methylobacterium sp. CG08_land_8_20_14_0_20_71_15]GBU18759.1 sarcosine oxidase subunit delta [Methylobacterium sp.]GJE05721.1 Sarcosine oxidase subunit delta [Methylobacterium jeotgali]